MISYQQNESSGQQNQFAHCEHLAYYTSKISDLF
jgi:hypothetical protein